MHCWYAIDGEVHTAGTAFRVRERDTARLVIFAGCIVRQVAELVRRSHETINGRGIAGSQLQVRGVGALAVREGVEICVWDLGFTRWGSGRTCGRCHGDDAR